jgi:hypothetical protein
MGPQKKFLGSNQKFFPLANYHQISNFLITVTTIAKGKEWVFHFKPPEMGRNLFLLGEGVVTFMSNGFKSSLK